MNLSDKQDIGALLARWPARLPGSSGQDEEKMWDDRANAAVRAAHDAPRSTNEGLDALLAAPTLAPEPGESGAAFRSGGKKMAQEKEPGDTTAAPKSIPPTERRRGSLKEIAAAARAGARPSQPGTPIPSSTPTPMPMAVGRASRPPMPTPIPGSVPPAALPKPTEAGKEDSGVIHLDAVRAAATPAEIAAAEKAKPGQVGLFADDPTVESAVNLAEQPAPARPTNVSVIAVRRNRTGPIAGAAIALLGIAAAFAILHRTPGVASPPTAVIATQTAAPEAVKAPPSTAPQAKETAAPVDVASLPSVTPEVKQPDPGKVAAGPSTGATGATATAGAATASKDAPGDPRLAAKPTSTEKPGDLQSEMARAVGVDNKPAHGGATAEPAAAAPGSQSIPEQPSQGSVQAAIGAVLGSAKACVADADDISRAMVTFSSAGTVSSVSVSGWAAAHGKAGCVEAALKAAKVGPFSKASYSVPVPVRP